MTDPNTCETCGQPLTRTEPTRRQRITLRVVAIGAGVVVLTLMVTGLYTLLGALV